MVTSAPIVTSFAAASAIRPDGEARYAWEVPDGWQQGKGAFGGLVLGTLLRAMEACEADPARRVRSLSGEIPAPVVAGPTTIEVEVLRRGGGTTFLSARARQAGATVARASALLAASRPPGAARIGPRRRGCRRSIAASRCRRRRWAPARRGSPCATSTAPSRRTRTAARPRPGPPAGCARGPAPARRRRRSTRPRSAACSTRGGRRPWPASARRAA
ncbi:MAG: thioesterase family protein [Kofleriaceae bacterium]|nr:thioesterase family protein [Kofleriaceae bacterium]